MSEPSIFTRIINGEINQRILYQDSQCFVILTHEPMTPGHLLVIPREQIDHLWDTTDALYQHLMMVAKKMALKLREVYDYERIGMIVEGFGVPHAHIHVLGIDKGFSPLIIEFTAKEQKMRPADELEREAKKLTIT